MADNFKTNLNISCHLVPVEVPMFFFHFFCPLVLLPPSECLETDRVTGRRSLGSRVAISS